MLLPRSGRILIMGTDDIIGEAFQNLLSLNSVATIVKISETYRVLSVDYGQHIP